MNTIRNCLVALLLLFPILLGAACDRANPIPADRTHDNIDETTDSMGSTVLIKVGSKEFTATLLDNSTTTALKVMLPLTISMTELNGNEKYYRLSKDLPTDESNPKTINSGDLMLWGSNTLVVFYEPFSTSYRYTKIGKIDDPTDLASALGSGNVTVTIQVK